MQENSFKNGSEVIYYIGKAGIQDEDNYRGYVFRCG